MAKSREHGKNTLVSLTAIAAVAILGACGSETSATPTKSTATSEQGTATPGASESTSTDTTDGSSDDKPATNPTASSKPKTSTSSSSPASTAAASETAKPAEKLVGNIDVSNLNPRAVELAERLAGNPTDAEWKITGKDLDPKNFCRSYVDADFVVRASLYQTGMNMDGFQKFRDAKTGLMANQYSQWAFDNFYTPSLNAAFGQLTTIEAWEESETRYKKFANRASLFSNMNEQGIIDVPYQAIMHLDEDSIEIEETKKASQPCEISYDFTIQETVDWTDQAATFTDPAQGKPIMNRVSPENVVIVRHSDGSYGPKLSPKQ